MWCPAEEITKNYIVDSKKAMQNNILCWYCFCHMNKSGEYKDHLYTWLKFYLVLTAQRRGAAYATCGLYTRQYMTYFSQNLAPIVKNAVLVITVNFVV